MGNEDVDAAFDGEAHDVLLAECGFGGGIGDFLVEGFGKPERVSDRCLGWCGGGWLRHGWRLA